MAFWNGDSRRLHGVFKDTRLSFGICVLVALAVIAIGIALDGANTASHVRELHIRTENEVNLIRTRVVARINNDVTLMRDLANLVALGPSLDEGELERQINWLLIQNPHLLKVTLAPDFKVSAVLPPQGSEDRIGSDVREPLLAHQSLARNAGQQAARFYGPVAGNNRQNAFAILFPVFVKQDGKRRLWGAIEAAIDQKMFYESTGLKPARNSENQQKYPHLDHLSIALRDMSSPAGLAMQPFLGERSVFGEQPVRKVIDFAGGRWELAALPNTGWDSAPENQAVLRAVIISAGGIIIASVFFVALLIGERNRNIFELEAREAKLLELSQRLDLALESSNIGVWELCDGDDNLFWDVRSSALHERPSKEGCQKLEEWLAAVVPEDRPAVEAHFFSCSIARASSNVQYRIRCADGSVRHLRSVGSHDVDGAGAGKTIGIVWDVTSDAEMADTLRQAKHTSDIKNAELELALEELSSREQQLDELSRKLDFALDSYRCGIWEAIVGRPGALWDERMRQLYCLDAASSHVSEEQWLSNIHPEDRSIAIATASMYLRPGDAQSFVCRILRNDGEVRYVRSVGKVHAAKDGGLKIIGIAFDVTDDALMTVQLKAAKDEAVAKNIELELAKDRIEHNALHDPLTGLANRRKLDIALEALTADGRAQRQRFAILHIDLDRFKDINDTLGHAAGDAMLVHASRVLAKNVRGSDIVARIGGDEFVIVATDTGEPKEMAALAGRVIEEMRQPIDFQGFSCRCGVSIGIAQAGGTHIDARKVLINADIALYRAKSLGRNRFEFFNQNLQAEIINSKRTADEILAGLDNGEFTAWYQPQFDAKTMQLTGVEALVRWNHPVKGVLAPDKFLRIADELNVVHTLDRIVLETALKDKMLWAARGIAVPKVSVNVSSRRLHDGSLIDTLTGLQIRPGEISFELVESIFLDESEDVASQNLERIKGLGIDIEIDDFGTGHTSIVSLLKLRPKRLKIDRQLVKPILVSTQERSLVRSIIEIARSLGVETVAEGVETWDHAVLLRELGCDLLQGFAFARPLSFEDFTAAALGSAWRMAS